MLTSLPPTDLSSAFHAFYETYQALDWPRAYQELQEIEDRLAVPPSGISFIEGTNGNGVVVASGGATVASSMTFRFAATDPSQTAGFVCSLDGAGSGCSSPVTYFGLLPGAHTFVVSAVNAAGQSGPPAAFAWTVWTPAQATQALIDSVRALGVPYGVKKNLIDPLQVTLKILTNGKSDDDWKACRHLEEFRTLVALHMERGRLTADEGAGLSTAAWEIQAALACR